MVVLISVHIAHVFPVLFAHFNLWCSTMYVLSLCWCSLIINIGRQDIQKGHPIKIGYSASGSRYLVVIQVCRIDGLKHINNTTFENTSSLNHIWTDKWISKHHIGCLVVNTVLHNNLCSTIGDHCDIVRYWSFWYFYLIMSSHSSLCRTGCLRMFLNQPKIGTLNASTEYIWNKKTIVYRSDIGALWKLIFECRKQFSAIDIDSDDPNIIRKTVNRAYSFGKTLWEIILREQKWRLCVDWRAPRRACSGVYKIYENNTWTFRWRPQAQIRPPTSLPGIPESSKLKMITHQMYAWRVCVSSLMLWCAQTRRERIFHDKMWAVLNKNITVEHIVQ